MSPAVQPSFALWSRTDAKRNKLVRDYGEVVRAAELTALESKVATLKRKMKVAVEREVRSPRGATRCAATMRPPRISMKSFPPQLKKPGGGKKDLVEAAIKRSIHAAEKQLKKRSRRMAVERERMQEQAAIDFLGLRKPDVAVLKATFRAIDVKRRGHLRLAEFFTFLGCASALTACATQAPA